MTETVELPCPRNGHTGKCKYKVYEPVVDRHSGPEPEYVEYMGCTCSPPHLFTDEEYEDLERLAFAVAEQQREERLMEQAEYDDER